MFLHVFLFFFVPLSNHVSVICCFVSLVMLVYFFLFSCFVSLSSHLYVTLLFGCFISPPGHVMSCFCCFVSWLFCISCYVGMFYCCFVCFFSHSMFLLVVLYLF